MSPETGDSNRASSTQTGQQVQRIPQHPIASGGKRRFRYHPAQHCFWSRSTAGRGEIVGMRIAMPNLPGECEATISVHERDSDGKDDLVEKDIAVTLVDGAGSTEWTVRYVDDSDDDPEEDPFIGEFNDDDTEDETDPDKPNWNPPEFYFKVKCDGEEALSPILKYREDLELTVEDDQGQPVESAEGVLIFTDGTERKGKVRDGVLRVKDVPPLSFIVNLEGYSGDEEV